MIFKRLIFTIVIFFFGFHLLQCNNLDQTGTQWTPYLEWTLKNSSYTENPFDLIANVTFTHKESGKKHKTQMFYAGDDQWKFRFTGTKVGEWTFISESPDPELDNKSGTVIISPNSNENVHGFMKKLNNKWGWQGTEKAFVPQYVMYKDVDALWQDPAVIDKDIQEFIEEHGFSGLQIPSIGMGWFDITKIDENYEAIGDDPKPDFRTFETLEKLIVKVHQHGGSVHIWCWGDEQRKLTPLKWGANGKVDQRLQRYIAARLGPIPGWSMCYGFDLWEWTNDDMLTQWHDYLQEKFGWFHFLGARSQKNQLTQISEAMDYSSYEEHRPDYQLYVEMLMKRSNKPSFAEDRFRIRNKPKYKHKDYNLEMTRRGLWQSAMAGGVANIWGYLLPDNSGHSNPYPNKAQIKTCSEFFKRYFQKDMVRDNSLTDGYCLKDDKGHYIFYKENTSEIQIDLSAMDSSKNAVKVNTMNAYEEIPLKKLKAQIHTIKFEQESDWVIAVGYFEE